jgi:hypothetical protein
MIPTNLSCSGVHRVVMVVWREVEPINTRYTGCRRRCTMHALHPHQWHDVRCLRHGICARCQAPIVTSVPSFARLCLLPSLLRLSISLLHGSVRTIVGVIRFLCEPQLIVIKAHENNNTNLDTTRAMRQITATTASIMPITRNGT